MKNPFFDLQEAVAERLLGVDEFVNVQGIAVVTERLGDLRKQLESALMKTGLGLTVITPEISPGTQLPNQLMVEVVVAIVENVTLNQGSTGTRVSAMDLVAAAFARLTSWSAPGGWGPLVFKGQTIGDSGIKDAIEYDVKFETSAFFETEE